MLTKCRDHVFAGIWIDGNFNATPFVHSCPRQIRADEIVRLCRSCALFDTGGKTDLLIAAQDKALAWEIKSCVRIQDRNKWRRQKLDNQCANNAAKLVFYGYA